VQKGFHTWARACQSSQRSKVSRHTVIPLGYFTTLAASFLQVHIDLVEPLPTSADTHTASLQSTPGGGILDIISDTVARPLLTCWISCFGCLQTITTDQGHQFESQILQSLAWLCYIQLSRTTSHHPSADGLAEHFHWTLKTAIMCHADQQWIDVHPFVLFGIRTAFKEDLQAPVPELMYGEPLRIPGELPTQWIQRTSSQVRQHMTPSDQLRQHATLPRQHLCTVASRSACMSSSIIIKRRALEPPYSCLYRALSWIEKTLQVLVRGRHVTASTDMVKLAYILNGTGRRNNTLNPPVYATPALAPPAMLPQPTTRF
jgi:cleavage and polyadenylation specificity factor subunit 1